MASNPTFITRTEVIQRDYIALANDAIKINGYIDVNSELYQNAIEQYNKGLANGTLERLDVPEGFCGYIDPNSGTFRVESQLDISLRDSTLYPTTVPQLTSVPQIDPVPYPIDCQLQYGLPGSYAYTKPPKGDCAEKEDGDGTCSGIAWYSGGETEAGTEGLDQSICGSGPGINSNTGVASSSPVTSIPSGTASPAWNAAEARIRQAEREGKIALPGLVGSPLVASVVGDLVTYAFYYNVYSPAVEAGQNFRPSGMKVTVVWNRPQDKVVKVTGPDKTYNW